MVGNSEESMTKRCWDSDGCKGREGWRIFFEVLERSRAETQRDHRSRRSETNKQNQSELEGEILLEEERTW
jgi:hypothetical protein